MDTKTYKFSSLESKYENFLAPSFSATVGSSKIESGKIPITSMSVDIEAGRLAGGASFTIEGMYDPEHEKWQETMLGKIKVGDKLVIEAGYVKREQVFFGYVDEFTVDYGANQPPTIIINGIDAKGYLMNANNLQYMVKKKPAAVVKEILNLCVSKGFASKVTVGTLPDTLAELIQNSRDDYSFICSLADLFGVSFFVVNGEIVFDEVISKTSEIIELILGASLLSFSKTLSLKNQIGKVVVSGVDPKNGKTPIKGEASSVSVSGSGKTSFDTASGYSALVKKVQSAFVSTPEECKKLAQNILDNHAMEYVSGHGRCLGIPELIPGRYIKLSGMDDKTSGKYYIKKVRHAFRADEGYFTEFEVSGAKSE